MTAVSQNLSIVLLLRAELWSGSPTKTRLPKPADVGVRDCSPEMWCVPDGRWHEAGLPSGAAPEIAPELTGHGLPFSKCEAYNRVYDQFYQSR